MIKSFDEVKIYVRICCVVTQELDGCPADGSYRGRVQEAVTSLQSSLVPSFSRHVDTAAAGLQHGQDKVLLPGAFWPNIPLNAYSMMMFTMTLQAMDENEFIEACRLVYDGVREVRRAVLSNRGEVGVGLLSIVNPRSLLRSLLAFSSLSSCLMVFHLAPGGE